MRARQVLIIGAFLLVAVLLQTTLLNRLQIPGASPDLVLVTVIALAFPYGPLPGAVTGFAAGMLIDLAPPGNGPVGISALILTAVGLAAGRYENPRDRSVPVALGVVAVAAAAAVVLSTTIEALFGSPRIAWDQVASMCLLSALYAVLMAPGVLGLVGWVVRKLTPEALL